MILTAEEFVKLRRSEDPAEYHRATYDSADMAVWMDVIHKFHDMKEWVVHNKTVPIEILKILSTDSDEDVRYWVAGKRKITLELFEILSLDISERVKVKLIANPKVPESIVDYLENDPSEWVRAACERHRLRRNQK